MAGKETEKARLALIAKEQEEIKKAAENKIRDAARLVAAKEEEAAAEALALAAKIEMKEGKRLSALFAEIAAGQEEIASRVSVSQSSNIGQTKGQKPSPKNLNKVEEVARSPLSSTTVASREVSKKATPADSQVTTDEKEMTSWALEERGRLAYNAKVTAMKEIKLLTLARIKEDAIKSATSAKGKGKGSNEGARSSSSNDNVQAARLPQIPSGDNVWMAGDDASRKGAGSGQEGESPRRSATAMSSTAGVLDKLRGGAINPSDKEGKDKLLTAIKIVLKDCESATEGEGGAERQSSSWTYRRDIR